MEKRILIARWLGSNTQPIPIYDEASVSSARQRVREAGAQLQAGKELVESVALIASELTHNQLSHAKQGYFAVRPVERQGVKGLEVIAADLGPGIGERLFTKTRETKAQGSLRAGVEGVFRLADEVEIDSRVEEGTCVVARKFETRTKPQCEIAILGRPYPGEAISGDDGVFFQSDTEFLAAVSDGLGHGPEAREASNRAIEFIAENRQRPLDEILAVMNTAMVDTRGCAMCIVRFVKESRTLECLSAGDIHAHLYNLRDTHFFTSTPMVVGDKHSFRRTVRVESITAAPGSVFVMFTDGLESKTSLKGQLDLLRQPVVAVAQHLIATHGRANDDALVLVARIRA